MDGKGVYGSLAFWSFYFSFPISHGPCYTYFSSLSCCIGLAVHGVSRMIPHTYEQLLFFGFSPPILIFQHILPLGWLHSSA